MTTLLNGRLAPVALRIRHWLSASSLLVVASGALLSIMMVGLCAVVLYQSRQDALDHTRDTLRDIALIAERDITRNIELYALSLQAVVDGERDPEVMALQPRLRRDILFDRAASARYLSAFLVLDAHGDVVLDSAGDTPPRGNFAHQPYFIVQRDHPNAGLYLSDPVASPLTGGVPAMVLSRRLSHPDGSFAGIALLAVNLDYFHTLFAGVGLGARGSLSLIAKDGTMIMRQPYDPAIPGRNIRGASTFRRFIAAAEGSFEDTASIDGVRRLYWFQNFSHAPLIIMAAAADTDIYAAWRHRALTIGGLMVVFGSMFIGLSALLGVQIRRRLRAESELKLLARTDGLTGLDNRRSLSEILDHEWCRAKRTHGELSLLFIDIDRFKAYNDTYGHQAGDDALATVARCITDSIRRPGDTAARYGGEEFVAILPDTSAVGAVMMAERIRTAICLCGLKHAGSEYGYVTASIGVVSWQPKAHDDLEPVMKAADEALYHAKANGRNRVSLSDAAHGKPEGTARGHVSVT